MKFFPVRRIALIFGCLIFSFSFVMAGEKEPGREQEPLPAIPAGITWHRSLSEASAAAKKQSLPLMIDFEADWCGWCKKLDRETYSQAPVIRFVSAAFIAVKVDADKESEAMKKYKVSGLPTILFLEPGGQELGRIEGFREAAVFLEEAQKASSSGAAVQKLRQEAEGEPKNASAQRAYARMLIAGGKNDEAEAHLKAALERLPDHRGLQLDLADVMRLKGRFAEAVEWYQKVAGDPKAGEDRNRASIPLTRCWISLGKLKEGEKAIGRLLEGIEKAKAAQGKLVPDQLEALFLRGYLRAVLGRPEEAIADLALAQDGDPEGPWGQRAGFILIRLKN